MHAPVIYPALKAACRAGLSPEERKYWWPVLPNLQKGENVSTYPDVEETAMKLAAMTNFNPKPYSTNEEKVSIVMLAVSREMDAKNGVKETILVARLMRIVCRVVENINVCHLIGCDSTSKTNKYIALDLDQHRRRLFAFREYLQRFIPKTYTELLQIGALHDRFLNLILVNLCESLLPPDLHLTIMDAFLLEGWRILIRYGLALLRGYKAQIKARTFTSGEMFWNYLEQQASNPSPASEDIYANLSEVAYSLPQSSIHFLLHATIVSTSNLNTAVERAGPAVLSSSNADPELKTLIPIYSGDKESSSKRHMLSNETIAASPTSRDGANCTTSTLAVDSRKRSSSNSSSIDESISGKVETAFSRATLPFDIQQQHVDLLLTQSKILTSTKSAVYLLSLLPTLIKFRGLEIVYSSSDHGFDLHTLYRQMEGLGQCVVVIHTVAAPSASSASDSSRISDGDIIGAYVSESILPPSTRVKGTGMSFVFSISGETKYSWNEHPGVVSDDSSNANSNSTTAVDASYIAATQQFAVCASDHIAIGASAKLFTNAIRIDEHIRYCYSGESDTFNSPCLLTSPRNNGKAEILQLEIFVPLGDIAEAVRKGARKPAK